MIPTEFDYKRATSMDDAIALLKATNGDGKFVAGGHSLVPLMKLRLSEPSVLIDIIRVPGLGGIREKDGKLEIGATTTHHDVATSDLLKTWRPSSPKPRARSVTPRCATAAPSAAAWPTATRPPTCRP